MRYQYTSPTSEVSISWSLAHLTWIPVLVRKLQKPLKQESIYALHPMSIIFYHYIIGILRVIDSVGCLTCPLREGPVRYRPKPGLLLRPCSPSVPPLRPHSPPSLRPWYPLLLLPRWPPQPHPHISALIVRLSQ